MTLDRAVHCTVQNFPNSYQPLSIEKQYIKETPCQSLKQVPEGDVIIPSHRRGASTPLTPEVNSTSYVELLL